MASPVGNASWDNDNISKDKLQCHRCPRSFQRLEHLRRHQRGHEHRKQFVCPTCYKAFARSDILHRHEFTHKLSGELAVNARKGRACSECARAREKCTKDQPCMRCLSKSLECSYPPETRKRQSSSHALSLAPDDDAAPAGDIQAGGPATSSLSSVSTNQVRDGGGLTTHTQLDVVIQPSIPLPPQNDSLDDGPSLLNPYLVSEVFSPGSSYMTNGVFPLAQQQSGYGGNLDYLPLNWLPANQSVALDYNSILGLNLSSYDAVMAMPLAMAAQMPFAEANHLGGPSTDQSGTSVVHNVATDAGSHISPPGPTSPRSQSSDIATINSSPGSLYATSTDGARVPCTIRSKRYHKRLQHTLLGTTSTRSILDPESTLHIDSLTFKPLNGISFDLGDDDLACTLAGKNISRSTYGVILESFQKLCLNRDGLYTPYLDCHFPSLDHLNFFIRLYFEHFDPLLPIVHGRLNSLDSYWPLAVAMSAIGSQYTGAQEVTQCIRPLHEFVRRVLAHEIEKSQWERYGIPLIQAFILSQVGMLYAGSSISYQQARARGGILVELTRLLRLFTPESGGMNCNNAMQSPWELWLNQETMRRLGYAIWLLDCMSAYHFGQRPILPLDFAECALPDDQLWSCTTAEEWLASKERSEDQGSANPSLSIAIIDIFLKKEAKRDVGEFSRILLLHGIYAEISKINGFLSRPLSSWVPSMQRISTPADAGEPLHHSKSIQSDLSNWRNAALDCVDVLHWAANATIAGAAGIEHATVLHLHLSRVILLAPYDSIQTLAKSIASLAPNFSQEGPAIPRNVAKSAEREVVQWAQRDEHKARLAVLHCGCLFWHIRRYSCDAFYEPISVFLATLTLWAYSSYASRAAFPGRGKRVQNHLDGLRSGSVTRQATPERSSESRGHEAYANARLSYPVPDDEDDREPTFIRLDRPNDDEMVQLFVRSGRPSVMRAYITGVGNVCSPQGPVKILREGRKVLSTVSSAWGRTQEHVSLLAAIEKIITDTRHL